MNWFLLNSGPCPPAFNMALDEALLEAMPRLQKPALRFYGWTEPAASFGYFQRYADVERATLLRPLVRRPTGGGIVPHNKDWTYSVVFPPGHEWHSLKAEETYRRVHEWIRSSFEKLGIKTELAPCRCELEIGNRKSEIPSACFVGHVKFDVLWNGKKIAGAAQRRNKLGLLIQGSVQPPMPLERIAWQQAMCDTGQAAFKIAWDNSQPDKPLQEQASTLARQKYSRPEFIARH